MKAFIILQISSVFLFEYGGAGTVSLTQKKVQHQELENLLNSNKINSLKTISKSRLKRAIQNDSEGKENLVFYFLVSHSPENVASNWQDVIQHSQFDDGLRSFMLAMSVLRSHRFFQKRAASDHHEVSTITNLLSLYNSDSVKKLIMSCRVSLAVGKSEYCEKLLKVENVPLLLKNNDSDANLLNTLISYATIFNKKNLLSQLAEFCSKTRNEINKSKFTTRRALIEAAYLKASLLNLKTEEKLSELDQISSDFKKSALAAGSKEILEIQSASQSLVEISKLRFRQVSISKKKEFKGVPLYTESPFYNFQKNAALGKSDCKVANEFYERNFPKYSHLNFTDVAFFLQLHFGAKKCPFYDSLRSRISEIYQLDRFQTDSPYYSLFSGLTVENILIVKNRVEASSKEIYGPFHPLSFLFVDSH